jgi:hypothetical protein
MLKKNKIEVTEKLIELWKNCVEKNNLEAFQNLFDANFEFLEMTQKKQILSQVLLTPGTKEPSQTKKDRLIYFENSSAVDFLKQWCFAKTENHLLLRDAEHDFKGTIKPGSEIEIYYLLNLNYLILSGVPLSPYCRIESGSRRNSNDLSFIVKMHLRSSFLLVCYYFHRLPPEREMFLASQEALPLRAFEGFMLTLKLLFGETPKEYELELPPVKDYRREKYRCSELREDAIPELESYLLKELPQFILEKNKTNKKVESVYVLLTGRFFSQPLIPIPDHLKKLRDMIMAFMEKHREHKDQVGAMQRVRLMSQIWLYYYEGVFTQELLKSTQADATNKSLIEPWGGIFSNQDTSISLFMLAVEKMIKSNPSVNLSEKPKVNETVMKTDEQTSGSNNHAKEAAQSNNLDQELNSKHPNNTESISNDGERNSRAEPNAESKPNAGESKNIYPTLHAVSNNLSLIAEETMMMHQLEAQHRSLEMLRAEIQHAEALRQHQESLRQQYEAVRNRLAYLQNEIQGAQLELIDAQGDYQQLLVQSVNPNPPTMIAPVIPATSVVLSPITRYADIQKQAKEAEKVENPQPPVFVGDLIDLSDFSFSPK